MTQFENSFSEEIWESTYKDYRDKSIDCTLKRVASAIASVETTEELQAEWTKKFYDMLSDFKATTGGRIYSNAGTEWAGTTLINCFVSPSPDAQPDSLEGIYEVLLDQAKTLKSEGGWGHNFSSLRPRGSFINGIGVESPGAVKFMEIYDKSSEIVTSGSGLKSSNEKAKGKIRKGAMMGILDVWHPDIIEFVTAKQTPGRLTKFNISVNCTDDFMDKIIQIEEMKIAGAAEEQIEAEDVWSLEFPDTEHPEYETDWKGDIRSWKARGLPTRVHKKVSASWLWNLIIESTYNRAEPGVVFLDRANDYYASNYVNRLVATNPCIPGHSYIQTNYGPRRVTDLLGKEISLLVNGQVWKTTSDGFFKTGHKPVYKLQTKEGFSVETTDDHLIAISKKKGRSHQIEWKEARDLKVGDKIIINDHASARWEGEGSFNDGYLMGLLFGDGYISRGGVNLCVWPGGPDDAFENNGALDIMNFVYECVKDHTRGSWSKVKGRGEYRMKNSYLQSVAERFNIQNKTINKEIIESSPEFYKGFISGLFDADGSVQGCLDGGASIRLSQSNRGLLEEIQRMLIRLGIYSKIYNRAKSHTKLMSDGKGGKKEYTVKDMFELSISADNMTKFIKEIGFKDSIKQTKALTLAQGYKRGPYKQPSIASFTGLEYVGDMDVYDCQVPGINAFDSNGVLVHNCGEQVLPYGGSCNLGSLNLTQFVREDGSDFDYNKLRTYAKMMVRFLDNVNDYTYLPLPEYEEFVRNKRRVGVGLLGWGSALYMLKVRFGSEKAQEIRDTVVSTYARACYEASIDLAEEKGMFDGCDPELHAETKFVKALGLSEEYVEKLRKVGIRNSAVLSCQPTGNTSIVANVASGGIEPVFMPEYTRTVIVPIVPDEIRENTPAYWQGIMEETDLFKWTKEGDEDILRGEYAGTVYKIDRNRGLTKEVPCEDYGVRWLKARGEWDPEADWAATALNLGVQEHVNDLQGFARWIDSSISKTINVPFDYPFEDFKQVYLDAYKTGYIKGVTTYRSGTMTTVLSAKEEKNATAADEEIILTEVKLPDSSPAIMKILRAEGRKWYLSVLMNEDQTRPVAFFVHTNAPEKSVQTNDAVDRLFALAELKGIPEEHIESTKKKISGDNNSTKIARAISLLLRHGVLIKNVVSELERMDSIFVGSFLFQIKKYLASYVRDGERVEDAKCQECNSTDIIFQEGCHVCKQCGSSKCS